MNSRSLPCNGTSEAGGKVEILPCDCIERRSLAIIVTVYCTKVSELFEASTSSFPCVLTSAVHMPGWMLCSFQGCP